MSKPHLTVEIIAVLVLKITLLGCLWYFLVAPTRVSQPDVSQVYTKIYNNDSQTNHDQTNHDQLDRAH